ncbi:MAG: hypothetical protein LKJ28_00600, partial [Bifidobacteriaceae bacterium]|nr:hypothetical protein [Bifidobacteriaceae bacterium]
MNEEIITKNVNSAANKIVSIIFGVLSSYALLIYNNKVFINRGALGNELTNELGDILPNLAFPVFSLFLAFCYSKTFKKIHFSLSACILSFLFSVFTITGLSFSVYSDERLWGKYFLPNNASNFFGRFTLLAVIGFGLIYYVILANLFNYFDNYTSVVIKDRITSKGPLSTVRNFIDKHPFACAAIVIAICWIPYFVIFYPGAFMTDGYRQLNEFYGYIGKTTHHPYLATTIMGLIFSIGKPFGLNAAMFIYTTIQGILGCLAFAYTISQAYRLVRDSKFSRMALLVFGIATANFALFPIYPMSMGIIYKDNPYIISTLIFFTIIVVACVNKKVNLKTFFLFLISGIGVLAFRNDGILIFIVGSVCLLFLLATGKKKIIVSSIVMTLTLLLLNS